MKTILMFLVAICMLCAAQAPALAQAEPGPALSSAPAPPEFSARVKILVDTHESIRGLIANCLARNLEGLENVVITNENPQYHLTIMALPNSTRKENIGFTLSVLITRPFDGNLLRPLLFSKAIGENEKKILLMLVRNYERIEKISLLTTPPDGLAHICEEIVTGFSTDILERDRQLWEIMWNRAPHRTQKAPPD